MITNFKKMAIIVILTFAFLIRGFNFFFPSFTSGEARIAYRGATLASTGKDELGRSFPILFNSLEDYQLPMVSYLAAGGEMIFSKSELGVRLPFIIIGTALVLLVYQIAKFFSMNPSFWFISAFVVSISPVLIFLSKEPNEAIVLTFIFTLLFYLLVAKKSLLLVIPTMIISVLTSKQAWLILFPFTFFTLIFFQKSLDRKRKLILIGLSVLIVLMTFTLFLIVPQAKRSLLENNFSIFSDITIKNGIDRLRGQGMKAGWPENIDRLLFNKMHFITVGILHNLSNITPAVYFGQFDGSGELSYSYLGAWPKILIIPLTLGLFFLIKRNDSSRTLLLYFLLLTFPSIFIYPVLSLELVVLTLPFMALIIAFGFANSGRKVMILIFSLAVMELMINIFNLNPDYKNTTVLRPSWIKGLISDIFEESKTFKTAVSDDIALDMVSYIEWYASINPQAGFQIVPSPYKFRQYQLADIKIIGSHEKYNTCGKDEKMKVFVSKRDLNKINWQFQVTIVNKYQNNNAEDVAYLIEKACVK